MYSIILIASLFALSTSASIEIEDELDRAHQIVNGREVTSGIVLIRLNPSSSPSTIEYLLVQKYNEDDNWTPPKGHIDLGENAFCAARRETEEEVNLYFDHFAPGDKKYVKLDYCLYKGEPGPFKEFNHISSTKNTTYLAGRVHDERAFKPIQLSSEHKDYTWLPYAEARKLTGKSIVKATLDHYDAYFQANPPKINYCY